MIRLGELPLQEGRLHVAVSFTDADARADVEAAKAAGVAIAELRIDLFASRSPTAVLTAIERLSVLPTLATIRLTSEGGAWEADDEARAVLFEAVLPHVDGIDVELAASGTLGRLAPLTKSLGKVLVVSNHDFEKTPSYDVLAEVARRAVAAGADIVKIAAKAEGPEDTARLERLLLERPAPNMVVIGMGQAGMESRLLFPLKGSLFTFAAKGSRASAPGQIDYATLLQRGRSFYPGS
jgi:3-dehydroquinate dehydratase-1